ncbi:hypothetical protein [uncultured Flavobacterium sp.]|uniref:hypothetical protein n=1 Tax=uncultured Flavobacterium sp. TaxID=165435 RepID=UPI0025E4C1EE|nr:hypothetical protein [uncultured Flavobacterium sp.]
MANTIERIPSDTDFDSNYDRLERVVSSGKSTLFTSGKETGRIKTESTKMGAKRSLFSLGRGSRVKRESEGLFQIKHSGRFLGEVRGSSVWELNRAIESLNNVTKASDLLHNSFFRNENIVKLTHGLTNSFIFKDEIEDRLFDEEIEKSKYIYGLEDDWDENNSQGYTYENWQMAIQFVIRFRVWIRENLSKGIQVPKIYHGPQGSIDILWEETDVKIYYNIDGINNKGSFYSYYGEAQKSGGEFELNEFDFNLLPHPVGI